MQKMIKVSEQCMKIQLHEDIGSTNLEFMDVLIYELSKELSVNPKIQCINREKVYGCCFRIHTFSVINYQRV